MSRMKNELGAIEKGASGNKIDLESFRELEDRQKLRLLLSFFGLPVVENLAKSLNLSKHFELETLITIIGTCYCSETGPYPITQACFNKLISCIETLDLQDEEENGLLALAMSGLLNEENIELFAANPEAFCPPSFNDEEQEMQSLSEVKSFLEGVIATQKGASGNKIDLESFRELEDHQKLRLLLSSSRMKNELGAIEKGASGNKIDQESFTELEDRQKLRLLLSSFGLPVVENLAKSLNLSKHFELETLITIMGTCYCSETGPYPITQACFNKLISCIETLDLQDEEENGLLALAMSGLLNEENIELFAANPEAFCPPSFNDEEQEMQSLSEVKSFLEEAIAAQKEAICLEKEQKTEGIRFFSNVKSPLLSSGISEATPENSESKLPGNNS